LEKFFEKKLAKKMAQYENSARLAKLEFLVAVGYSGQGP
jgi:hypothetical protein